MASGNTSLPLIIFMELLEVMSSMICDCFINFGNSKVVCPCPQSQRGIFLAPGHIIGPFSKQNKHSIIIVSWDQKMKNNKRQCLYGIPQPIHVDRGMKNIQFDRDTRWIQENLLHQEKTIHDGGRRLRPSSRRKSVAANQWARAGDSHKIDSKIVRFDSDRIGHLKLAWRSSSEGRRPQPQRPEKMSSALGYLKK